MDGVLVDSYDLHFQSWQIAGRQYGLELRADDFAQTFGRTSKDIIHRLWPDTFSEDEIKKFDHAKEASYRELLEKGFKEVKGAGELIGKLHAAGFRMAIGSSGAPKNIELVKKHLANGSLITTIVNGTEVTRGKPDPEVFQLAAQKLKLDPKQCVVLEDAPVGLDAARRAGTATIGVTGTAPRTELEKRADRVVDNLSELSPSIIEQIIRLHAERT